MIEINDKNRLTGKNVTFATNICHPPNKYIIV